MPQNDHRELKYQIALTMVPAIGPITARKLIKKVGSASAVFDQKKKSLEKIPGIGPRLSGSINAFSLLSQAEKELEFLEKHRIKALYFKDPKYPHRLNQCDDGPVLLYSLGEAGLHCRRSLSVVGTRRATSYGRDICRKIILGLSERIDDLVIVSGLAYGIDVIAHRAALDLGLPTVAVLGHGMSTIYPWAHREVAHRICSHGALVSDFHSQLGPERNNFLRRNRIIAGLSDATIVVESAEKGGALITAHMAASYNRDVLAVPGRADDVRSRGCNALIKNSLAALVESPGDIINHLNWEESAHPPKQIAESEIHPNEEERKILEMMVQDPNSDAGLISNMVGIPIQRVLSLLIEMELKDWISPLPGNRYKIRIRFSS